MATKTAKTTAPKSAVDRVAELQTEASELVRKIQSALSEREVELAGPVSCSWGDVGDMGRVLVALTEAHRVLTNGEG